MKRPDLDFLNAESEYRTVQLRYVNLIGSYLTAAQSTELCRGPGGDPMTDKLRRHVALMAALFLLALAVACSGGRKAAPTKSEVTVDPNLYQVDHPELFKLAKVGTQNLPTLLNANGAVTPDVNRNIHFHRTAGKASC